MVRSLRTIVVFLAISSMGVTCYGPGRETREPALLRVRAVPEDARVTIDEHYVATARTLAVRPRTIPSGRHQITIEASGYFPHDLEVDLPPGESTLDVSLRPVPP